MADIIRGYEAEFRKVNNWKDRYTWDDSETSLGKGKYGSVFKATIKETGETVAIKQHKMTSPESYGVVITAVREIQILESLQNDHIVQLKDCFMGDSADLQSQYPEIYMVMEYCKYDLMKLLERKVRFSQEEIKCIMYQIFDGLNYLHEKKILHRDIKGNSVRIRFY